MDFDRAGYAAPLDVSKVASSVAFVGAPEVGAYSVWPVADCVE
jgi:hypothetical protein